MLHDHFSDWCQNVSTTNYTIIARNRPDIRLNPVPAGYPASISSSGQVSKNFAGFVPDFSSKSVFLKS